ncbi:hypothetical protein PROFUN_01954 [Planoprotostelium fungivorum]|uniref:DUF2415 domain-containing protein n=1 Tax=Planoprotostelium fungivorum TaxID=1890364 RepID=A0A2P6NAY4_9EUKA|nr:hypothetical protein PROFUN_01954 [Planoprotostelium fungivorum]
MTGLSSPYLPVVNAKPTAHHFAVKKRAICPDATAGPSALTYETLTYRPYCISEGFGFVAAGGHASELFVRGRSKINNSLCFSSCRRILPSDLCKREPPGDTHLIQSNNDCSIRIFNIPDTSPRLEIVSEWVQELHFEEAINYSAVSPDSTMIVSVGDSCNVHLIASNSARSQYSSDYGFGCAWSESSLHFAVCSQDGNVFVWDVRSTSHPLAKLKSVVPKAACRTVKFTRCGFSELLMFSEHQSYVHIVDARTYQEEQVIHATLDGEECTSEQIVDITGIAFSNERSARGSPRYGKSGIYEYRLDTSARRTFYSTSIA